MKIYTLTLNPAYDVHATSENFEAYHESLAHIESREAGGKGVNISRALANAEIPNTAVIVLGKENAGDFKAALAQLDFGCLLLEKEGRIRENLTLHTAGKPETRISFAGFSADDSLLDEVLSLLEVDSHTIVTVTGRLTSGISAAAAKCFLRKLTALGAKIVLDSKSFSLADILELQPWLIKPNQEEISEYLNCPVDTVEQALEKAMVFAEKGIANVMVSLGAQGAMLVCDGKSYIATPPCITPVSTVGAGDSMIAGFLSAVYHGNAPADCLKTAVAYGTAACLTAGTLPPQKQEAERIYNQVTVMEGM
ncbi:MAG: hexose kinase [Oscillospiraceae bacterium]|nr:hexose kinase [Oscillospiraceae bacterium]